MPATRKMHLVAYLKTGPTASYASAWRHPTASLHDIWDPERYEDVARLLEEARFDALFFADGLGLPDLYKNSYADYVGRGGQISLIDPMTVLPLMARVTRHLGLASTISTTFNQPYHIARALGSLDLLSKGRAAWNVVTSATDFEARNVGLPGVPLKSERYDRADDVLEACCKLWDCWDADALVMDKASGVFADASKIRYADHAGPFVSVRGPMSIPRSPQGRPVILQAGSSPRGRECAVRWADVIFCTHATKDDAIAFRDDIHGRLRAANPGIRVDSILAPASRRSPGKPERLQVRRPLPPSPRPRLRHPTPYPLRDPRPHHPLPYPPAHAGGRPLLAHPCYNPRRGRPMMHLVAIPNTVGGHLGGWRHPAAFPESAMNL